MVGAIASHIRRVRPDVVVTFGPDGAYGHPDHIAISQFTSAAVAAAGSDSFAGKGDDAGPAHLVSKLYYIAWPETTWRGYEAAFRKLVSTVDGVERQAVPWPDWAITTTIDTRQFRIETGYRGAGTRADASPRDPQRAATIAAADPALLAQASAQPKARNLFVAKPVGCACCSA